MSFDREYSDFLILLCISLWRSYHFRCRVEANRADGPPPALPGTLGCMSLNIGCFGSTWF